MKRLAVLSVVVLVLNQGVLYSAAPAELKPADIKALNALMELADKKLDKERFKLVKAKASASSSDSPVSILAAALLYKSDPSTYEDQFYQAFSIHDYSARTKGKGEVITGKEMLSAVKGLEAEYKGKITDSRVFLLLAYCHYKDQNKSIELNQQRISVARFFRSAFLSAVLKDTDIDVIALTNGLDKKARAEDLKE